jgi:hypothetical protein
VVHLIADDWHQPEAVWIRAGGLQPTSRSHGRWHCTKVGRRAFRRTESNAVLPTFGFQRPAANDKVAPFDRVPCPALCPGSASEPSRRPPTVWLLCSCTLPPLAPVSVPEQGNFLSEGPRPDFAGEPRAG